MWLLGIIAGLMVGSLLGGAYTALAGAVLGGVAGVVYRQRMDAAAVTSPTSEARLRALEARVAGLVSEVSALQKALLRGQGGAVGEVTGEPTAAAADVEADVAYKSSVTSASATSATAGSLSFDLVLPPGPLPEVKPNAETTSAKPFDLPEPPNLPAWWSKLLEGNPLAKIGVVLLFFGVASALRLAVEYGLLPVPVRLVLATLAGCGLIAFGYFKARPAADDGEAKPALHRHFGLAIQGGGFALLYLVVYFMLARYAMLGQGPAFGLFTLLGVACVLFAARQDGPVLAIFGISGAFLAPVLAGGHSATPLPLFLYFTLLNVFILIVDWFRAWRALNVAGFVFTLAIGCLWAMQNYRPEHYLVTQCFLILYVLIYSATPVITLLFRAPGNEAWREGILIFGSPLVGISLQSQLVDNAAYAQAWSAFIAGIYYLGLWLLLFRRPDLEMKFFERSHLGIAIAFFTLAIPLAFDAQVTSAFWAAEGCAVLWFGVMRGRKLAQAVGLLMQGAAGISFLFARADLDRSRPLFNDFLIGGLILAVAGLLCARLLQKYRTGDSVKPAPGNLSQEVPAELPYGWALLWWFGSGLEEISHFVAAQHEAAGALLLVGATAVLLEWLGQRWRWALLRHSVALLLSALLLAATWQVERFGHPLGGLIWLVLPLAIVLHYVLLARQENAQAEAQSTERGDGSPDGMSRSAHAHLQTVFAPEARHLGAWWLAVAVAGWELAWWGERAASGASLWSLLAWGLTLSSALALTRLAVRRDWWPWASAPALYQGVGVWPIAGGLGLWIVIALTRHAGQGSGLPYVPVFNAFDLVMVVAVVSLYRSLGEINGLSGFERGRHLAGGLGFLWLTTLAGRIAYHWDDVPWNAHTLWHSTLAQALVTVFWTLAAIAAMIVATRIGRRPLWMGGMGLLGVVGAKLLLVDLANSGTITWTASLLGVAVLLLAAGYFSPAPPKADEVAAAAG